MITLALAIAFGGGTFAASHFGADIALGWSITWGVVGFGVFQAVAGILIQKRVKREMEKVQAILTDGKRRLEAKMQRWQFQPPGSVQVMQRMAFEESKTFVLQAIAQTETLRRYRLWVPMMGRQIATAKLQLAWMIKDYKTVDELMPKAIMLDPTMAAIKMARLYMLGRSMDEIEKVYRKGVARTRYNGNVLLAGTMSWMQVKKGDADGAFRTLTEALKKSDDATLKANHEHLMNNRVGHFSNSGLGDQWYALSLEEPKIRTQRTRSVYR